MKTLKFKEIIYFGFCTHNAISKISLALFIMVKCGKDLNKE